MGNRPKALQGFQTADKTSDRSSRKTKSLA